MAERIGEKFERLVGIMRALRAPDGCPWDREQTIGSLRPFVLEETYEVLEAIEHQAYPLQRIVEDQRVLGGSTRSTLFNTMFVMRQSPRRALSKLTAFGMGGSRVRVELGSQMVESAPVQRSRSQFDLALSVAELDGRLFGSWEYSPSLFSAQAIDDLSEAYRLLLASMIEDAEKSVGCLPVLSARERAFELVDCNQTSGPLDEVTLLHEPFEACSRRCPHELAIIAGDVTLTYEELDRRATAVASWLLERGLRPTEHVAIVMEKGWEQIVAALAVSKAGGAY